MTAMSSTSINGTYRKQNLLTFVVALFPSLFLLANQYRMFGNSPTFYVVSLLVFGAIGVLVGLKLDKKSRWVYYGTMLLFAITESLNVALVGNTTFEGVAYNILIFGLVAIMFVYPHSYFQGIVVYYVLMMFFIPIFLRGELAIYILTSSQNYVSVCLILAASIYYIGVDNGGKGLRLIDLLPALLCFMLSVWAMGRGGILTSLFLLTSMSLIYLVKKAIRNKFLFILIPFLFAGIVLFLMRRGINPFDMLMSLGKLESKGMESTERMNLWVPYIQKLTESPGYFFFGVPLTEIPVIMLFEGNTHNSFIQLHAYNGIVMVLVFVVLLIKSLIYYIKKRNFLLLILTLTVVFRGMTDKFIFGQYGMPIMMYLVLYPYLASDKEEESDQEAEWEETETL